MRILNAARIVLGVVVVGVLAVSPWAVWLQAGSNRQASDPATLLQKARVNGVDLHYQSRGGGAPIVFVHGTLADYREWGPVAEELMEGYRTVTYSRRYNFPNDNAIATTSHSAIVEAADLAALNRQLGLGAMHVVGASYGAYTALMLALREPGLIRTLTLVEPPLLHWLPELPGGAPLYDEFYRGTWQAAGRAFKGGDSIGALRIGLDFFVGPGSLDQIPAAFKTVLLGNVREWEALTTSSNAFPRVSRDQIRKADDTGVDVERREDLPDAPAHRHGSGAVVVRWASARCSGRYP